MANRAASLELAVLGLLSGTPMHGYELRKRVTALFGWGRVLSYGSLYPSLKQMLRDELIVEDTSQVDPVDNVRSVSSAPNMSSRGPRAGRRGKIVYKLTAKGKERFGELVSASGPSAWDDDNFGVRFAFFGATATETRLRILEGRRNRLEERLDGMRMSLSRSAEVDSYASELQRHELESVEREVRWLSQLIDNERAHCAPVRRSTARPGPSVIRDKTSTNRTNAPAPTATNPE
ncbi:MAG: PadR family transcriptional regulator [Actinomycetota bacterium]|nr:PadR family transcriptional regulator [Nocardioidaceae bacterium]MDQ3480509.1 PadR family transcriptional regulator [Actinomycetota bacterium]